MGEIDTGMNFKLGVLHVSHMITSAKSNLLIFPSPENKGVVISEKPDFHKTKFPRGAVFCCSNSIEF